MTLNLNEFDVLVFDIGKIKLAPQLLLATACFVDCKDCFGLSCHLLYWHIFVPYFILTLCLDIIHSE